MTSTDDREVPSNCACGVWDPPMRLVRSACVIAVAASWFPAAAAAQSLASGAHVGDGLAGVGVLVLSGDAADRTAFPNDSSARAAWLLEGAVFVAPRAAVGIEAIPLGTVTGSSNTLCCMFDERER